MSPLSLGSTSSSILPPSKPEEPSAAAAEGTGRAGAGVEAGTGLLEEQDPYWVNETGVWSWRGEPLNGRLARCEPHIQAHGSEFEYMLNTHLFAFPKGVALLFDQPKEPVFHSWV